MTEAPQILLAHHLKALKPPTFLRDHQGRGITVAEAKALVVEQYTVPETVRASRRANRPATIA